MAAKLQDSLHWAFGKIGEQYTKAIDRFAAQRKIPRVQVQKGQDNMRGRAIFRAMPNWPHQFFLCVLAYYVEWHLRRAWAPLLFGDEERREERKHRDPVLPAQPSSSVQRKKRSHETADGLPVHSFETLMKDLGSRARVTYALKPQKPEKNEFNIPTVPELCKMRESARRDNYLAF